MSLDHFPPASDSLNPIARSLKLYALLSLETASVVFAVWTIWFWDSQPGYVGANQISSFARNSLIFSMLGLTVLAVVAARLYLWKTGPAGTFQLSALVRLWAPLAVLGLMPLLLDLRTWIGRDLVFLSFTLLWALGLRLAVLASLNARTQHTCRPQRERGIWFRNNAAFLCVLAGAVLYSAYFSWATLTNHYNLRTASLDLGLEDNLVWNILHGGPWFKSSPLGGPDASHFGYHATFFSYVIAQIYRFAPRAETLLVLQAVLIGFAAIPLYLLGRQRLSAWAAALLAFAYLLYAPLHGSNLYDFHYQPLAPFFLWFMLWSIETRRPLAATVFLLFTLSLREDMGTLVMAVGAFLLFTGQQARAGLLLAVLGAVHFLSMKLVVMPLFAGSETFVHQYQGLLGPGQRGFVGVLVTILGNLPFTLHSLLTQEKLIYLLQIFTPLLFLPVLRPGGWLLCIPGIIFTLMSTGYTPLYQISFQYTAYWTACLFIGLRTALGSLADTADRDNSRRRQLAWLAGLAGAMLVTSHQYGAVMQREHVRGGFGLYHFGSTAENHANRDKLGQLLSRVPPLAKIVASETLVPQVSNRPDAYTLRTGVFDAEYLLFILPIGGPEREQARRALQSGSFGVMSDAGNMVLARRGHAVDANAAVLLRM